MSKPEQNLDQRRNSSLAAERTWLAWWRTSLGATAGALAVGRFAPDLLDVAPWPYIVLGCGYGVLAIALLICGALRQRALEAQLEAGIHTPLSFRMVGAFTGGGILLALITIALVIGSF
jgi:putative membrane protein